MLLTNSKISAGHAGEARLRGAAAACRAAAKDVCFSFLDDAVRVTNACVRQMQMGGLLQISDNIVSQCEEWAIPQRIEAIDVMLELSATQPESFMP